MARRRWIRVERPWWLAAGVATGVLGGYVLWRGGSKLVSLRRRRRGPKPGRLEKAVVEALLEDPELRHRPIEVAGLAEGLIELSGSVANETEAHRAVALAQRVPGVRTVLNRLADMSGEAHLAETRARFEAGDPALAETHWYGQGVGMGRRRQSETTDPARPDEHATRMARALGTDRAIELTSERLDKMPPGVEGHSTRPAGPVDRGQVDHASHRRLGNVPETGPQDLNPSSGVLHEIKKAERMRLEEVDTESPIGPDSDVA